MKAELICQQIISGFFFKTGFLPAKKLPSYQNKSDRRVNTA
jgi:hypothetical protein